MIGPESSSSYQEVLGEKRGGRRSICTLLIRGACRRGFVRGRRLMLQLGSVEKQLACTEKTMSLRVHWQASNSNNNHINFGSESRQVQRDLLQSNKIVQACGCRIRQRDTLGHTCIIGVPLYAISVGILGVVPLIGRSGIAAVDASEC